MSLFDNGWADGPDTRRSTTCVYIFSVPLSFFGIARVRMLCLGPAPRSDIVLLIIYVNDMVIIGSDLVTIASLKRHLQSEFEMKDLSFLLYFLGIKVAYLSHGYLLSQ